MNRKQCALLVTKIGWWPFSHNQNIDRVAYVLHSFLMITYNPFRSVYCLEFDSQTIITGSRDKTIKIWSLRTGKLQATLRGHAGSVLCLKFDKSGFMVSGSSDCSVFVWDLNALTAGARTAGSGAAAAAAGSSASAVGTELVRRVLKGHTGGVLDLRIDDKWIVSWCVTFFTQYQLLSN